jgi:hypothetical protein
MTEGTRMDTVTVRKHTWRGEFRYAWSGELLMCEPEHLVLLAIWKGPGEPRVGEIAFMAGDRFVEHYYPGRGYAIWQVEQPDGRIKGWYCNISTPVERHDTTLSFRDLLLDLLVYPDGRYSVLDREEFAEARREGLPESEAALAEAALAEVVRLVERGAQPFCLSGPARALELS